VSDTSVRITPHGFGGSDAESGCDGAEKDINGAMLPD
jgi:hypothetical protein